MKLVEYLTMVVSNPQIREHFCEDPRESMQRADLSEAAQEAIKSGDPKHVAYVICVVEAPATKKFDPID